MAWVVVIVVSSFLHLLLIITASTKCFSLIRWPKVCQKLPFKRSFTSPLKGQTETEANARLGPYLEWATLFGCSSFFTDFTFFCDEFALCALTIFKRDISQAIVDRWNLNKETKALPRFSSLEWADWRREPFSLCSMCSITSWQSLQESSKVISRLLTIMSLIITSHFIKMKLNIMMVTRGLMISFQLS